MAESAPARSQGGRDRSWTLAVVAISALIGATSSLGVATVLGAFDDGVAEAPVAIQPLISAADGGSTDEVAEIAARTARSVAAVRAREDGTWSSGSAVAFRSDGHLLTNARLVDSADEVAVMLHDGATHQATVVGTDALTDLAVVHIDVRDLETPVMGSSAGLRVGMRTVAVGASAEDGWHTAVTTGVVSALERRLRLPDGVVLHDMVLIDSPFSPGTAGGAVVDAAGTVIGISNAHGDDGGDRGDDRFGVMTPIDLADHVGHQLIDNGVAEHVWMGVEGSDLATEEAISLGLGGGASIARVVDDSPAAAAGLRDGDVLVAVDGRSIRSMSSLIAELRLRSPGDVVRLRVWRVDEELELELVLAPRPTDH